jgi:hypothetical protein
MADLAEPRYPQAAVFHFLACHHHDITKERYRARRTGSMFSGGAPAVGITVEKLLEAEDR